MSSKEGYDVLRLIEHGQICYISSEYVEGRVLANWLKFHPHITKEKLFGWIQSMTRQLSMIHKCRKKSYYQYVNPYSIVLAEDEELYFLDMDASSNEKQLKLMRRRVVREAFLPAEEPYYQKASIGLDIYGLGKTIQYLLSISEPDPPLSKREEKRFQRIISKCLKRQSKSSYQNVSEIRKVIPIYKTKAKNSHHGIRRILVAGGIILASGVICKMLVFTEYGNQKERISQESTQEEKTEDSDSKKKTKRAEIQKVSEGASNDTEEYMELAIAYFLDVEDYEKSLCCLNKIRKNYVPAVDLGIIVQAFLSNEEEKDVELIEKHLKSLEEQIQAELIQEKQAKSEIVRNGDEGRYYHCLVKGYGLLGTEEASEEILRLGRKYLDIEGNNSEEITEIQEYMASAYEKMEKKEEAAHMYEVVLEQETDAGRREELYRNIVILYEACDRNDRALDTCVQGIEELKDSEELRMIHIRLLCKDASVGRDVCAQTIREYIRQIPKILEKEEFQKLQREYEIHVEGEEVWVGN
ncbi:hypothetical protein ACQRBN_14130 [Bariatricus sp. SGI.154]|uniref:hypothetical protein n=1 Tax=Bariatricus sp. SGI.154 TaxID=3420549 RepID=UPI003D054C18